MVTSSPARPGSSDRTARILIRGTTISRAGRSSSPGRPTIDCRRWNVSSVSCGRTMVLPTRSHFSGNGGSSRTGSATKRSSCSGRRGPARRSTPGRSAKDGISGRQECSPESSAASISASAPDPADIFVDAETGSTWDVTGQGIDVGRHRAGDRRRSGWRTPHPLAPHHRLLVRLGSLPASGSPVATARLSRCSGQAGRSRSHPA